MQNFTTTTVENHPGGGRWARIVPNATFLADPDSRRAALMAYTEAFTTSPPARIRGSTIVRLDGPGRVFVGLQGMNASNRPGAFLGGFVVDVPPLVPVGGALYAVNTFNIQRIQDILPLPSVGTLQPYSLGNVVNLSWTIDQATRTLSLNSSGATVSAKTVVYPAVADGVSNSPLEKIMLSVWLQSVNPSTRVFLDDLFVEEF